MRSSNFDLQNSRYFPCSDTKVAYSTAIIEVNMHALMRFFWLVVSLAVMSHAYVMSMRKFLSRNDHIRNLLRVPRHQRLPRKVIVRLNGSCEDESNIMIKDQDQIKLDVGGHTFTTTRSTLTRFQDTLFSDMFSSTSASQCPLGICEDGYCRHHPVAAFFDRGTSFTHHFFS